HRRPPTPTPFPYTTLFRSAAARRRLVVGRPDRLGSSGGADHARRCRSAGRVMGRRAAGCAIAFIGPAATPARAVRCRAALRLVRSEEHTSELQSLAYLVCR